MMLEDQIKALELARLDAMARNDIPVLEKFFAEDFEFISGDGRNSKKDAFLKDMREGNIIYRWIKMSDARVFAFGTVAIIFHKMRMKVFGFGEEVESGRAATSIWRKRGGTWQIVIYKGVETQLEN
jgi:ketosteroid isomerase-like protein